MSLWLWCRLAAVALIRPLAWEPPYAEEAALEKEKKAKRKEKEKEELHTTAHINGAQTKTRKCTSRVPIVAQW